LKKIFSFSVVASAKEDETSRMPNLAASTGTPDAIDYSNHKI
jgi:hypothetical protein